MKTTKKKTKTKKKRKTPASVRMERNPAPPIFNMMFSTKDECEVVSWFSWSQSEPTTTLTIYPWDDDVPVLEFKDPAQIRSLVEVLNRAADWMEKAK